MIHQPYKWGIIGLGKIAHKMAQDIYRSPDNQLIAVASRRREKAIKFADRYDVPNRYARYLDILNDPDVDVIYVATPHAYHYEWVIKAMRAGKHVLCEKPLAMNQAQVQQMIEVARREEVFLMEGLWSRFNPSLNQIIELINADSIGALKYIQADFCFNAKADDDSRLYNLELGGGALLDIGIYPIFLAYVLLGMPQDIIARANKYSTGADQQTAVTLMYNGAMASLSASFSIDSAMSAKIYGSQGHIFIDPKWHETDGFVININGDEDHVNIPTTGNGFMSEISEVNRCISANKIESSLWSHQHSLDLMNILDQVRVQIGLRYPDHVESI